MLTPPLSRLPRGATKWATVNDVAIRTKKDLRSVRDWCANQLVFTCDLVGGYGGLWVAVDDDNWPITNPEGVKAYRERRRASSRVGAAASVAARRAKAPKPTSRRPASRRSA